MSNKTTKKETVSKKQTTNKKGLKGGFSKVAGSVTGAAIGAAIGGLAGAALSNDKTKQKLGEVVSNLGEYAQDAIKENEESLKKTTKNITSNVLDKK